ncbi:MAG: hypothetical protein OSP8Acid_05940 [uncultured Acidilobus sp. OSP8]|nr:MAG: hypothetical protein OSP8Acid_05940 [uncultured Acidilobus sp. OSP8]
MWEGPEVPLDKSADAEALGFLDLNVRITLLARQRYQYYPTNMKSYEGFIPTGMGGTQ